MDRLACLAILQVVLLGHELPMNFLMVGQMASSLTQRTGVLHRVENCLTDKLTPIGQISEGTRQITVHFEGNCFLFGR